MSDVPRLYTPRLCLRALTARDAPRLSELAGDRLIAATTSRIPHPYPDGHAEQWISTLAPAAAEGKDFVFGITLAGTRTPGREHDPTDTGHLIGNIGLHIAPAAQNARAEIGYWVGVPYWGKGFATEAAHAVLDFAFSRKELRRVAARHFANNPASGRVMKKLGMSYEGLLRQHECKWGEFLDVVCYGILATEWQARKRRHSFFKDAVRPQALTEVYS